MIIIILREAIKVENNNYDNFDFGQNHFWKSQKAFEGEQLFFAFLEELDHVCTYVLWWLP